MTFVMVIAITVAGCGKKEEAAEKKDEPKVVEASTEEKESDTGNIEDTEIEAAEPADEGATTDSGEMKTDDDVLSEEDIQDLKNTIRDTVISEYIEPNNVKVEDFSWPDEDSGEWGYMVALVEKYNLAFTIGYKMDISEVNSSAYSNPKIIEAAFNGITYWIDEQGKCDLGYVENVFSAMFPYDEVLGTIDLASK